MNPHSTPDAFGFPTAAHPAGGEQVATPTHPQPDEDALDRGIAESFPASDPVSVTVSAPPRAAPPAATPADPRPAWRRPAPLAIASSALLGLGAAVYWAYGVWQRRHAPRRGWRRLRA